MNIPMSWSMQDNKLVREFEFADFDTAMSFISHVADLARELNHHPEIWNAYNRVKLALSTHDAGGVVTEKDREFAEKVNNIG